MKNPMNRIERFCCKHPNFGVSNLMLYISAVNVGIWLLSFFRPEILSYITFVPALIMRGQVWRIVSFIFYPPAAGPIAFIAFYFYYWIGNTLEQHWGTPQFNIFFFSSAALTVLFGMLMYLIFGQSIILSAEYIYLSMFFAFAVLFPDMQLLLFFIIPIKIKYLAIIDAIFFVLSIISTPFPANLIPVIALANFLIFCGGDLFGRVPKKPSKNTINFRKESRRIQREQAQQLYNHKCCVCGRTDTDHPELEFRYCSRCAGYHCFCSEHINNHIHFTE